MLPGETASVAKALRRHPILSSGSSVTQVLPDCVGLTVPLVIASLRSFGGSGGAGQEPLHRVVLDLWRVALSDGEAERFTSERYQLVDCLLDPSWMLSSLADQGVSSKVRSTKPLAGGTTELTVAPGNVSALALAAFVGEQWPAGRELTTLLATLIQRGTVSTAAVDARWYWLLQRVDVSAAEAVALFATASLCAADVTDKDGSLALTLTLTSCVRWWQGRDRSDECFDACKGRDRPDECFDACTAIGALNHTLSDAGIEILWSAPQE